MVIEKIIDLFFIPLSLLVNMLPVGLVETVSTFQIPDIIRYGACFFPIDLILIVIGMWVTWYLIFMTWAIIEWVYKKIPGVS